MNSEEGALVAFPAAETKSTTNLIDKRADNSHSQSRRCRWIKFVWESLTAIGNGQHMTFVGIDLQTDGNLAVTVLDRVRDQLVDNKAQRNCGGGRKADLDTLEKDRLFRTLFGNHHAGEVATKVLKIFAECDSLRSVIKMKTAMDAFNSRHAFCGNRQLQGDFGRSGCLALQGQQADHDLQAVQKPMVGFLTQYLMLLD